jgi:hypothetical protein
MSSSQNPPLSRTQSRQKFTPEEDHQLRLAVERLGTKTWDEIAAHVPGRSPRQCRERYKNYLLDSITTHPWTAEEDAFLCQKVRELGPHWVQIANHLDGRSGNQVKNRWHKHLSKGGPTPRRDYPVQPMPPKVAPMSPITPIVAEVRRPAMNLCEAIGMKECDLAGIFTQLQGDTLSFSSERTDLAESFFF